MKFKLVEELSNQELNKYSAELVTRTNLHKAFYRMPDIYVNESDDRISISFTLDSSDSKWFTATTLVKDLKDAFGKSLKIRRGRFSHPQLTFGATEYWFDIYKTFTEDLREAQERTVYNALASWENYAYKYGKSEALFNLKYNFHLTDEELAWILKQLVKKELVDEDEFEWNIKYLSLEDQFPDKDKYFPEEEINIDELRKLYESLESASKELIDKFEGYYPIEDNPEDGSAYILPNGKFLNLYPATHQVFEDDLDDYDVYFPYLDVSIKVNDGENPNDPLTNPYMHIYSKPTNSQYESLLKWLDKLKYKKLDIWVVDKNNLYDLKEYIPEDIIKRIKKYFATGRLDEGVKETSIPKINEEPYPLNNLAFSDVEKEFYIYPNIDDEFAFLDIPSTVKTIPVKYIVTSQLGIDKDKFEKIKEIGLNKLPPISVVDKDGDYYLFDGNHRVQLANEQLIDTIRAKVYKFEDVEEAYYEKLNELENNQLTEGYLDDEEEFYDYGTEEVVDKDIFDINKGESPYAKEMIKLSKTGGTNEKGLSAEIIQMTPREYFKDMARGFNSTFDKQIWQIEYDKKILDHLKQVITKYKRKFPITYINVDSKYGNYEQEGRHRMYVAGELFGWDTKFPVLKIFEKDKEKADKIRLEEKKEKYSKILRTALRKAEPYSYRDLDELKEQVDYELESEFSYQDDPKYTLEVKDKGNDIDFILNDLVTITRNKEDFDINPDKPEFDLDAEFEDLSAEEIAEIERELGIKFN